MTDLAVHVEAQPVTGAETPGLAAWRTFLQAHATLVRLLEAELDAESDISLADFDVLFQLAAAPGQRLRMSELADVVLLSRSGMTRRIDRLESAGLVERFGCPSDRRGAFAGITEEGMRRMDTVRPRHVRSIDEHFVSRLTPQDLESVRSALSKVLPAGMSRSEGNCGG